MSCPDCFKGSVMEGRTPKGEVTNIHGFETYVSPPMSTSVASSSKIIYLCDAFGLELVNNKLLVDVYADGTGCRVLAPACIPGGPAPVWSMHTMEMVLTPVAWTDFWGQIGRVRAFFATVSVMLPFMIKAAPTKPTSYQPILAWTRKVKAEMAEGGKIGVAGFCWGGWPSTKMCAETATESGSEPLIDAQYCAHPSGLSLPDMVIDAVKTFKVPYSLAVGDKDVVLSSAKVNQAEAALRQQIGEGNEQDGYHYEFKIYPGVGHGFSVRGDMSDETILKAMGDASAQAVNWFKRFL